MAPVRQVKIKVKPADAIKSVDKRIDDLTRRCNEVDEQIKALPFDRIFTDEHRLMALRNRVGEEIAALRDRRDALQLEEMGLAPAAPTAPPKPAPAATVARSAGVAFTPEFAGEFTAVIREFVERKIAEAEARCAERLEMLEASQADVLARGIFFSGTWQRSLGYGRGSLVVHEGSLWAAVDETSVGDVPGASNLWQLAAKAGRNGKDADGRAR